MNTLNNNQTIYNKSCIDARIQELISELEQCREDERDSNNQMLSVLSTAATILGVLFGASYLSRSDIKNLPLHSGSSNVPVINYVIKLATNTRVFFWLTCFVFNTAFLYIVVLGIKNVLRYYHMRDIQDRLHELINHMPDDEGRGELLSFNEFAAPIVTMNLQHVSSSHAALHFFAYGMAAVFAVLFSIGVVISQYAMIDQRRILDEIVFFSTIALMAGTLYLFTRLTYNARLVAQFAWDTAHRNKEIRVEMSDEQKKNPHVEIKDRTYERNRIFIHRCKYFLFPKISDWYKQNLVILGFIMKIFLLDKTATGVSFSDAAGEAINRLWPLILSLLAFEYLAYQARYQINDIRGIIEDKEANKKNKLIPQWFYSDQNGESHELDIKQSIQLSLKIACLRCFFAVLFSIILLVKYQVYMPVYLVLLLAYTVAYEIARKKGKAFWVFLTVGTGYPLRFLVGINAANQHVFSGGYSIIILISCIVFFYGIFSSILSWTSEVVTKMDETLRNEKQLPSDYHKKHYGYLQNVIKERYLHLRDCDETKTKLVLREEGEFSDPWNVALLLSVIIAFIGQLIYINGEPIVFGGCLVADMILLVSVLCGKEMVCIMNITSVIVMTIAMIFGLYNNALTGEATTIIIIEGILAITYFFLRYQPQFKPFNIHKILELLVRKILGEDICNSYFS